MQTSPDLMKSEIGVNEVTTEVIDVGVNGARENLKEDVSGKAQGKFEFGGDTNISALYWVMSIVKANPEKYLSQISKVNKNIVFNDESLKDNLPRLFYWKEVLDTQDSKMLSRFRDILSVIMTIFVGVSAVIAFLSIGVSLLGSFDLLLKLFNVTAISLLCLFGFFIVNFFMNFSKSIKLVSELKKRVEDVSVRGSNSHFKNFEFRFPAFGGGDFSFLREKNTYFSVVRDSNRKYNYTDLSMYLAFKVSPFVPLYYQREELKDVATWGYKIYQELFVEYFKKGYLTKNAILITENIPDNMYWRVKGVARLHELFQESYSFSYASMFLNTKKYKKLATTLFSVMEVVLIDNLSDDGALSGSLDDVLSELKEHNAQYMKKALDSNLKVGNEGNIKDSDYRKELPIMNNEHLLKEDNLSKRRERILQAWAEIGDTASEREKEEEKS